MLAVSLRKGARATTAIEGNTLSEEEVFRIDAGENLPPSKEYLQIEVKNVIEALNQIRTEVITEDKAFILSRADREIQPLRGKEPGGITSRAYPASSGRPDTTSSWAVTGRRRARTLRL